MLLLGRTSPRAEFALPSKESIAQLIESAVASLDGDLVAARLVLSKVSELLNQEKDALLLSPCKPPRQAVRGGLAPWQIGRLTKFINDNIPESVVITDMAALVRLSPHHFCRAFRVSFAESPHRYLMRCRVAHAERLMRTTAIPLGQIAVDCGFADQAHFTKVFGTVCGMSPGAWRRREAERSIEVEWAVPGPTSSQASAKAPVNIARFSAAQAFNSAPGSNL